jgi:hypothetical protein
MLKELIIEKYNKDNYIKLLYGCVIYDKNGKKIDL